MLTRMGVQYASDGSRWKDDEPWLGVPEPRQAGRVLSPGGWVVPDGLIAAWNWLPPGGAAPRLDLAPWRLRCWYRTPFADRWAHACNVAAWLLGGEPSSRRAR